MEEIKKSFEKVVKARLESPMYGFFGLAWLLWNWKVFYVTFFIDQDLIFKKTHLLKIDYILELYNFNLLDILDSSLVLYSYARILLFPAVSVWFALWILKVIDHKLYEKVVRNDNEKKIILLRAQKEEVAIERDVVRIKKEKVGIEKSISNDMSKDWFEEYQRLKKGNSNFLQYLSGYETVYYERGGRFMDHNEYTGEKIWHMPEESLSYGDVNRLIDIDFGFSSLTLTEKGKFFLKMFKDNE